ncbi:hypothetical protein [Staphylococcus coagulans]|uniref:hypothetical protein n=1 Tax=Staphylococcus coagulans TaxID=74706 RepID=UPI0030EC1BD3
MNEKWLKLSLQFFSDANAAGDTSTGNADVIDQILKANGGLLRLHFSFILLLRSYQLLKTVQRWLC